MYSQPISLWYVLILSLHQHVIVYFFHVFLSYTNQVHIFTPYFSKFHFNIIPASTRNGLFLSCFPTKMLHASYRPHARYMSHYLIPLNLTALTIFGEQYKFWSTLSCDFNHPYDTSSLLCRTLFMLWFSPAF